MRRYIARTIAAFLPASLAAGTPAPLEPAPIMAMGAYVPTDNMEGAEAFYRALFDSAPAIELPGFVAFAIVGGWFAIVARDRYAPGIRSGHVYAICRP